jgi:FAD:protein FMN transferase
VLHRFAFRAMAADNEIQLHDGDSRRARAAADLAIAEVARIEAKYSRYLAQSVVSRINSAAGGDPVAIDEETWKLLVFAGECFEQSGGLFDATSGVLRRAWRFNSGVVPTAEQLNALLPRVGWRRVELARDTVRLPCAGMELDFGGFGKEYAVDRAARVLREAGVASGLVNLAGDLAILGEPPGGGTWQVGIGHPREEGALLATLPVSSGAIATSGDYERFIEADGVRHCHVLDPRTGRSAQGFRSVTVHAPSCLIAGTASTVAMLKGRAAGLAWLDSLALSFLAVLDDGSRVDRFRA